MNDMSQPPRPVGMGMPVQPNQELTAVLEAQEWNVVLSALSELPMRVSRPVFDRLLAQLNPQS